MLKKDRWQVISSVSCAGFTYWKLPKSYNNYAIDKKFNIYIMNTWMISVNVFQIQYNEHYARNVL